MYGRLLTVLVGSVLAVGGAAPTPAALAAPSAPTFLITPTSLDFGDQPLHSPSAEEHITFTNVSASTVSPHMQGGAGGVFGGSQNCQGASLAPGASCQVSYAFTPTVLGPVSVTAGGSINGQRYTTHLTGTGTPQFSISPTGLEFGHVPVGASSNPQPITVENLGTTPATLSLTGGGAGVFGGVQSCQGISVPAGGTCFFEYAFAPTGLGARTVVAKGTVNHQGFSFALHGVGTGPAADDFVPLTSRRVYDSRSHGTAKPGATRTVTVTGGDVSPDARAVDTTVTVLGPSSSGWLKIWPCGGVVPRYPTVQYQRGTTVGNHVPVAVGAGGKVCLRPSKRLNFTVDLDGYFPLSTGYTPLSPQRRLDSGKHRRLAAGSTTKVNLYAGGFPRSVAAIALNATALAETHPGHLVIWPCGQRRPRAATLSYAASQSRSAFVMTRPGSHGRVCVWTSKKAAVQLDVTGYYAPSTTIRSVPAHTLAKRTLGAGDVAAVRVAGKAGVGAAARAVLVQLTTSREARTGSLEVYPCGAKPPRGPMLSFAKSEPTTNVGVSALGNGRICVKSSAKTHVQVSVIGWYSSLGVT